MNDKSTAVIIGNGQGHQLELALARTGGNPQDISWLCTKDNFKYVQWMARGECEALPVHKPNPSAKAERQRVHLRTLKIKRSGKQAVLYGPCKPALHYRAHVQVGMYFDELLNYTKCEVCDEAMNRDTPKLTQDMFEYGIGEGGIRDFELVEFVYGQHGDVCGVTPGYALETFKSLGLRPATFLELTMFALHLSKIHANEWVWRKTIVGLGSSHEDGVEVVNKVESFLFFWSRLKKSGERKTYRYPCLEFGEDRKNLLRVSGRKAIDPVRWDESWKNEILFLAVHV